MSPVVDQDQLNTVFAKHIDLVADMGKYESIGKTMAARLDGLFFLYNLLGPILDLCPWCEINYGQWRDAALHAAEEARKKKTILNHSNFSDKIWGGQRAERWITVLYHMRRLKRNPELLDTGSKNSKNAQLVMKIKVAKLHFLVVQGGVFFFLCL